MKRKNYLSQNELVKKTGIKLCQIEYLIRIGEVPVIQRGRGIPRMFPKEAVGIIRNRLKKLGSL